ncbi:MAG: hypothetical protein KDD64_05420 [Bdellovibrionales bacterium]|nr:hypothetical protein [Bdellovibrionales bacterium]
MAFRDWARKVKNLSRKHVLPVVAIAALGLLFVVSGLFWLELQKRFPVLSQGMYAGTFRSSDSEGASSSPLFVLSHPDKNELLVAVLSPGWAPQVVATVPKDSTNQWLFPVRVNGPGGGIQLFGSELPDGSFGGTAVGLKDQDEGSWQVSRVEQNTIPADGEEGSSFFLRIELVREILRKREELSLAQAKLEVTRAENVRLRDSLTDSESLEDSRRSEGQDILQEHRVLSEKLNALREQIRQLYERLTIAQDVTPMGKLVSLARQFDRREEEWMTKQQERVRETRLTAEMQADLARSNQIRVLQQQIQDERMKIRNLKQGKR